MYKLIQTYKLLFENLKLFALKLYIFIIYIGYKKILYLIVILLNY